MTSIAGYLRLDERGTQILGGYDPTRYFPGNTSHVYWAEGAEYVALGDADGGAVSDIPDELGTDDLAQATGADQPVYRASVSTLNNRPAWQGDAISKFIGGNFAANIAAPYTVFAVVAVNTLGSLNLLVSHSSAGTTRQTLAATGADAWQVKNLTGQTGGTVTTGGHLAESLFAVGNDALSVDGTAVISGVDAGDSNAQGMTLFATGAGSVFSDAHIALVVVVDTVAGLLGDYAAFITATKAHYGFLY